MTRSPSAPAGLSRRARRLQPLRAARTRLAADTSPCGFVRIYHGKFGSRDAGPEIEKGVMNPYKTFAASLLFAAPLVAHHSLGNYDSTKPVTITGTVMKLDWRNP